MAEASASREERVSAQLRVRVRGSGPESEAHIIDASSRGMLLSAANPPQRGEIIEVVSGNQVVVGQVRWSSGSQFGVKLGDRIDARALAAGRVAPIQTYAAPAAAMAEPEPASEAGFAYNFVFFAAAAIASVGFLLTALQRSLG